MRTRWILFFALVIPVLELWQRQPYLLKLSDYLGTFILVLSASFWLSKFMYSKLFMRLIDSEGKAVLVTGCDTGFGNLLVKRLSRDGFFVYAGCLNASGDGAQELYKDSRVHVLQMDVTKDEQMGDALSTVKSTLGAKVLWAVVANAGIASHGLVEWESMESMRKVFEVNVFGVASVCKKFLPLVRKSKGRVVLVASTAGRGTLPGCVSYSMSKHAVISLADGLRRECMDQGVDVATIEPTMYRTNILDDVGSMKRIKKELELLPREVLDHYGENEITHWLSAARSLPNLICRDNINEVIDQMVLAIRECEPKPYYPAWGLVDPLFYFALRKMPAEFLDALIFILRKISTRGN